MIYPEITELGSKASIHTTREGPLADYMRLAAARGFRFKAIKSVDNLGMLWEAKDVDPETITIARLTHSELEAAPGMDDLPSDDVLRNMAETMILNILARSSQQERDRIDLWEVWNEPRPHTVAGYVRLAKLMQFTIEIAENHGLRVGIFSLNAGTPEWDEILAILGTGIMAVALERRAWFMCHEGLVGLPASADVNVGMGGKIVNPYTGAISPAFADAGPWLFRYRFWLHAAQSLRIELPPFYISEWGCVPQGYLHTYIADEKTRHEDVLRRFAWYDDEASRDGHLVGFAPFTVGQNWDPEKWAVLYPGILDHMHNIRDRRNSERWPLPVVVPPPHPEFVRIKVNELRKWNLRIGPSTTFAQGGAASSDTVYPVLEAVWGRTGTRVEAWYLVHPQGYPPALTPPLWIASSAVAEIEIAGGSG